MPKAVVIVMNNEDFYKSLLQGILLSWFLRAVGTLLKTRLAPLGLARRTDWWMDGRTDSNLDQRGYSYSLYS